MKMQKIPDRFFRQAVDCAFNHVVITDIDGKVLYANSGVEKITGFKVREVVGKTPRLWGRQMTPAFYKKLWKTIKVHKKPFRGEVVNRRKNGEIYYAIGTISPILGKRRELLGFLGVEEDVTDRKLYAKRLEAEVENRTAALKEKIRELDQMRKEQSDFITSASHQLRTPASVIQMEVDQMEREIRKIPKAKPLLEGLEVLRENNRRGINIMNDLFKVIELGEGYRAIGKKPMNLRKAVDQILVSCQVEVKKLGLKISVQVPKSLTLKVDEDRMKSALANLIDNAIAYSNEKGEIRIGALKKRGEVILSIADRGIGIPEVEQVNCFNKFFRARNAYLKKSVGTGLGLVIAKTIVEGHGGTLGFESKEGKGSVFTVKLPSSSAK